MGKFAKGRSFLLTPAFNVERTLTSLNNTSNPKMKANVARAMKSINTDPNEAIEEGTVATLIATCLEGTTKSKASDDLTYPQLEPQNLTGLAAPTCAKEIGKEINPSMFTWYDQISVTKGGAAGKGPDPPEPPVSVVDGSKEYPNMAEEVDGQELEGKTKMAFAKMPIPQAFKESFLLDDAEFNLKTEETESLVTAEDNEQVQAAFAEADANYRQDDGGADVFSETMEGGNQDNRENSPTTSPSISQSRSAADIQKLNETNRNERTSFKGEGKNKKDKKVESSSLGLEETKGELMAPVSSKSPSKKGGKKKLKKNGGQSIDMTKSVDKQEKKEQLEMSRQAQKLGLYS